MTVKEISEKAELSGDALALVEENSTPSTYLESLEQQKMYQDAIRFLVYKVASDIGVKWACSCIRELQPAERKQQKDEPLEAAEQWVKTPGDPTRWAAKQASDKSKTLGASKLVALAVFMSGNSVAPAHAPPAPPPPYLAQKMIYGAISSAVLSDKPDKAVERYQRALAMGRAMDEGGGKA